MRDRRERKVQPLPAVCPHCQTRGTLVHEWTDAACWFCGWRGYDKRARPIDDEQGPRARPGEYHMRGERR
jgi:hypothetical protein